MRTLLFSPFASTFFFLSLFLNLIALANPSNTDFFFHLERWIKLILKIPLGLVFSLTARILHSHKIHQILMAFLLGFDKLYFGGTLSTSFEFLIFII